MGICSSDFVVWPRLRPSGGLDTAMGPCEGKGSDEQSLLREMLDTLQAGDILVGDAFYATSFLLCELIHGGVDGLFEQYGARRRSTDFSAGESLGVRDHLIVLTKPEKKPDWMSQYEYDQAPATLKVRELHAGGKVMVTTFLCPKDTPKPVLKALYRQRWNIELDLRNIKTTLGMEQLRCKTPEMVCKELWVYLLAYNLIRLLMAQAALLADQIPRQLSFKHTVQIWLAWQQHAGGRTRWGRHQRPAGLDRRATGGPTIRAHRTTRAEAAPEALSPADQAETSCER